MRERISRRFLQTLSHHTPALLLCVQAQILMNMASRGFGTKGKRIWTRKPEEALKEYAEYTVQCMTECMAAGKADPEKLFREAYRTGNRIRRITGLRKAGDIGQLVFYLYRNIHISMSGNIPGSITVTDCYFSHFYTPQQCALMSQVDSGFISGLCGGGRLLFTDRITEGCEACRACFKEGE